MKDCVFEARLSLNYFIQEYNSCSKNGNGDIMLFYLLLTALSVQDDDLPG